MSLQAVENEFEAELERIGVSVRGIPITASAYRTAAGPSAARDSIIPMAHGCFANSCRAEDVRWRIKGGHSVHRP